MRNIILKPGAGKTTRLLAISEYEQAPIICVDESHRRSILDIARRRDYKIPNPITVREILAGRLFGVNTYKGFLVDESQDVLSSLISGLTHAGEGCIIGMTTSDSERM